MGGSWCLQWITYNRGGDVTLAGCHMDWPWSDPGWMSHGLTLKWPWLGCHMDWPWSDPGWDVTWIDLEVTLAGCHTDWPWSDPGWMSHGFVVKWTHVNITLCLRIFPYTHLPSKVATFYTLLGYGMITHQLLESIILWNIKKMRRFQIFEENSKIQSVWHWKLKITFWTIVHFLTFGMVLGMGIVF